MGRIGNMNFCVIFCVYANIENKVRQFLQKTPIITTCVVKTKGNKTPKRHKIIKLDCDFLLLP